MLHEDPVPLWKAAPFLRLVIPLTAGIAVQIWFPFEHVLIPLILFSLSLTGLILFQLQPLLPVRQNVVNITVGQRLPHVERNRGTGKGMIVGQQSGARECEKTNR